MVEIQITSLKLLWSYPITVRKEEHLNITVNLKIIHFWVKASRKQNTIVKLCLESIKMFIKFKPNKLVKTNQQHHKVEEKNIW